MANRRSFLKGSAAALSTLTVLEQSLAGMPGATRSRTLGTVVFDERIDACQEFAREARRLGADPLAIRGDLTEQSYEDLRARLEQRTTLIAGLTLEPAAASMHSLARDMQYHVLCRGEHVIEGSAVCHHLEADRSIAPIAAHLPNSTTKLGVAAAHLVSLVDEQSLLSNKATAGHGLSTRYGDANRLVSWVIGPIYN